MKDRPAYAIHSVDNVLLLLHMLHRDGHLRISDAAAELGVARSTAHRLISMLVYRDFVVQDEDRTYRPGPAMFVVTPDDAAVERLSRVLTPIVDGLCSMVGESVNLMVLSGTQTRFIVGAESTHVLRVGNRRGAMLPAARTSGGRALLAELPPRSVTQLYETHGATGSGSMSSLHALLRTVRRVGYAINDQETETGVSAIGMCVRDGAGMAQAALSIAVPSVRFTPERIAEFAEALREFTERAAAQLAARDPAGRRAGGDG